MPPGFVFVSHQLGLTDIQAKAMGVMFYLIPRIYDARPRAVLIINGGRFIHPQLQSPVERLDPGGVLRVLDSETGAAPWLRERTALRAF